MANEVRLIDANAAALNTHKEIYWTESEAAAVRNFLTHQPAIDPESLRPKGQWNIRCDYNVDSITREVDENFYLECSECKRQVWDIDQMAAMNEDIRKLTEKYPYCHCGAKMEG